jgi:hypothetical protein
MLYEIQDSLLGKGKLLLTLLALDNAEGFILKVESKDVAGVSLVWAFGGASGKKFSRDGDLKLDPESSFYLKAEDCKTNSFELKDNTFILNYGTGKVLSESERYEIQYPNAKTALDSSQNKEKGIKKRLIGIMPPNSQLRIADASQLEIMLKLLESKGTDAPVLVGKKEIGPGESSYFIVQNPDSGPVPDYKSASQLFDKAEVARKKLAERIKVQTPDPFINTLGGTLAVAADAIWEYPTFLHGAIGWRMRLNGWRGPYTGDPLGWHDRARTHFNAYAKSQVTTPEVGPSVPDPEKNLARQQERMGNALYTSGYICRNPDGKLSPHHYDMNLVFIDALIRHFKWTGDLSYIKEMWPVLQRHLAWEKRNFDGDNDGLYDAYCCIWASDALEYNGSGVAHSSAYNYLANKTAAYLAGLIGENPAPYGQEADKILRAMRTRLWMPSKGWFAEYQDFLGNKELHPSAALWTVYHTIDSEVPDAFQTYQMTRYVDTEIPHIPVLANGLSNDGYYVLSSSNWMPYDWSINNVVMAENLHTALAFWQSGRGDAAFKLWKSTLLDAMYLGSSPGNFVQMSFYDAARGEAYRDFADEIGMTSRSLVEGLFGISPNATEGLLTIQPGLPVEWDYASLSIPDVSIDFQRKGNKEIYMIAQSFSKPIRLKFKASARYDGVRYLLVNGQKVSWENVDAAIEHPQMEIDVPAMANVKIEIEWEGNRLPNSKSSEQRAKDEIFNINFDKAKILQIFDPQSLFKGVELKEDELKANIIGEVGSHTAFAQINQGPFTWWMPVCVDVKNPVEVLAPLEQEPNNLKFTVKNNTSVQLAGKLFVNSATNADVTNLVLAAGEKSSEILIPSDKVICGSNLVRFEWESGRSAEESVINWDAKSPQFLKFETIDLSKSFNDKVTNIFSNKYLSPRSPYPTLAIPTQGIGNWCYPLITANIDDSGLRTLAGEKNQFITPQGIPFATPGNVNEKNIVFTSLWDNYPAEVSIPLTGRVSHAYFLMAGSTNPMQSRITNGELSIEYTDGTKSILELRNPETWWPIEQDYLVDGHAFSLNKPKPPRVHLKTGLITRDFKNYGTIKGFTSYAIDGGAATILDLPVNPAKELKSLKLRTKATEVVIGLMSVTLVKLDDQNK